MQISKDFDVAVVGGGPGGSAAAKRCAEGGLRTLLLEKFKLPRKKVCTGMIMSEMSQRLVREEFGDLPEKVLTTPPYLRGIKFYGPKITPLTFLCKMPFAWRKDFDYWMNQVAQKAGAELWDSAKVKGILENEKGHVLKIEKKGETEFVKAKFLIGADGTFSLARKTLFPKVEMKYQLCIRQCYRGSMDLNPAYVHYFYFPDLTGFEVNSKDDLFLLEFTPKSAQREISGLIEQAEQWLKNDYGFSPLSKFLWRDGCFEPSMGRKPFSGAFPLAKKNAILVGDAAGLIKPIIGEGIGTALKSGLMAGEAVIQSTKRGEEAEKFYIPMAQDMVCALGHMYPPHGKIKEEARKGMEYLMATIMETFSQANTIL